MARVLPSLCLLLIVAAGRGASAQPWVAPGDPGLRNDIQRLADAGILRGPVTTWPLSWPDVARDALAADDKALDQATRASLDRVRHAARTASMRGFSGLGYRVAGSYNPTELREFAESPREEGEVGAQASWLGEYYAVSLQGSYVADPDDGQEFRADGSYIGVNIGNFMVSAGYMERWWGPGWDGSLILSTNARPIPSLTLERNYTDPFKTRLLSWLGPWRASIAVGQAEGSDVPMPDVRFLAARVNFKPRPWLEFGLTRTAQWCGGDRPCGWSTFTDLLVGNDNQVEGGAASSEQPGNQMAGYDLRLRSPWKRLPLAVYTQWIGEDEAGGLPSKFIGLGGVELWGSGLGGGWRLRAEYADTACNFPREEPELNCAYRSGIYAQGYSFRGQIIGHSIDNDSRLYSVAGLLNRDNGDVVGLTFRRAELNRDGGVHAITAVPRDVDNVELRLSRMFGAGRLSVGIGYEEPPILGDSSGRLHGFAIWQQGF